MKEEDIKWHPAFYSALQLEFEEDKDKLEFINELQLSKEPLRIDVEVIKKVKSNKLYNEIGNIFRKYNLIEYKSPKDNLTIKDFYKVHAYGCLYLDLAEIKEQIDISDITLTLCCKSKPIKLFKHLEKIRKYVILQKADGIYYIEGDFFPIQVLLNTHLSKQHVYLKSLDDNLNLDLAQKIIKSNKDNNNFSALISVLFKANPTIFEEVFKMSDSAVLEKVVNNIIITKGLDKKFFKEGKEAGKAEGIIEIAKNLISIGLPIEQIAQATGLSIEQIEKLK